MVDEGGILEMTMLYRHTNLAVFYSIIVRILFHRGKY